MLILPPPCWLCCPVVMDNLGSAVYQSKPIKEKNTAILHTTVFREISQNENCPSCFCFVPFTFYYVINCKHHPTWKAFSFWQCVWLCSANGIGNHPFFLSNIFSLYLPPSLPPASSPPSSSCSHIILVCRQELGWVVGVSTKRPNYWIGDSFGRRTESCSEKWLLIEVVWTHERRHFSLSLSLSHSHTHCLSGMNNICVNHVSL